MITPRQQAPRLHGTDEPIELLEVVRASLAAAALPLDIPGAEAARAHAAAAGAQLDDYILPRYRSLDAPLLAVVGGSTGAGKSTLVNSLIGEAVSRAGPIRPTTRQPLLLHHPLDGHWFQDRRVLPHLARVTHSGTADGPDGGSALRLLAHEAVPRGIALLDAPDIDSVADENRRLAAQLLAAADLWLFVTTANRYADAVPWQLLLDAVQRDILVAVVLDRVPPGVEVEVRADLSTMLKRKGLGGAELFVVPESALTDGLLPMRTVESLSGWLAALAADAERRAGVVRRTLHGAVQTMAATVDGIAAAQAAQYQAAERLLGQVRSAYDDAGQRILEATKDGVLLRGEVLARWQDYVGTGDFFRAVETNIGRLRDRIGAFFRGKTAPAVEVETAIETGLHAVIVSETARAAEDADGQWRADPAGRRLAGTTDLSVPGAGLSERAAAEIRAWQGDLLELIRSEGAGKRSRARIVSFGINGLAVALMIVVFASTAGLTGLELGIAGGSAVVGQKLLEAVFGEDAVRRLAAIARTNLQQRTEALLGADGARFAERVESLGIANTAGRMREEAAVLRRLAGTRLAPAGRPGQKLPDQPGQPGQHGEQAGEQAGGQPGRRPGGQPGERP